MGYFDDIPEDQGGYFDDISETPPKEPETPARGVGERTYEGLKGGFGDAPLGLSPENQQKFPLLAPFQPLIAGADVLYRAPGAVVGAAAGWGAGMLERNPNALFPVPEGTWFGNNRAEADRLQRDLTIIGQGAMIEPGMGLAAARPRAAEQQIARGAERIPDPPTPAEEYEFHQREQATRPPPPPPRPPPAAEPPLGQGQRGPSWREAMEEQQAWREAFDAGQTKAEMWEPLRQTGEGFAEIVPENGKWNTYRNGKLENSFASRQEAADYLNSQGFAEPQPPRTGSGGPPPPPPGAEPPPGEQPGAGPQQPPPGAEPPPGAGEFSGGKPYSETWEPSGPARAMGFTSGEIRQEGPGRFSIYVNGTRAASYGTLEEAGAALGARGFSKPGAAGAGPEPGPQPQPGPGPEAQAPPPPPPPQEPPAAEAFTPPRAAPRPPPEPPPRAPPPEAARPVEQPPPAAARPAEPPPQPAPEARPEPPLESAAKPPPEPSLKAESEPSYFSDIKEDVPPAPKEEAAPPPAAEKPAAPPVAPEQPIPREAEVSKREAEMLREAQARPEPEAPPPRPPAEPEKYNVLRNMLDPPELKAFDKAQSHPQAGELLRQAEARSLELTKLINDAGFSVREVNPATARGRQDVLDAKKKLSELGGSVDRLLKGLKPRKGRDAAVRLQGDIQQLREVLGEPVEPAAAPEPASKAAKAKPERRQSLLQFIAQNGGIRPDDPLIADVRSVIGKSNKLIPGYGVLIRPAPVGKFLDQHLEKAVEGRYIDDPGFWQQNVPRTSTIRDLLDAIDREHNQKQPIYPRGEEEAPQERPQAQAENAKAVQRNVKDILRELEEGGLTKADIDMESVQDAARAALNSNEGLVDLYERAVMAKADRDAEQARAGTEGEGAAGPREQTEGPRGEEAAPTEGEAGEGAGPVREARRAGEIDTPAIVMGEGPNRFGPTDVHTEGQLPESARNTFDLKFYQRTGKMTKPIRSMPLRQAIKELNLHALEGTSAGIARVFGKRLADVVGDVPVHILRDEDMRLYFRLKPGVRGDVGGFHSFELGGTPENQFIAINIKDALDSRERAHMVLHEGMHAAALGVLQNHPQFKSAIRAIMNEARPHFKDPDNIYAFANEHEFLSESIGNRVIQKTLSKIKAPPNMALIPGPKFPKGKLRNLWDGMVNTIRIATGFGPKFESLLDTILKVGEYVSRSPEHPTNILGMDNPIVDSLTMPAKRGAGPEFDFEKPAPEPPKAKDDSSKLRREDEPGLRPGETVRESKASEEARRAGIEKSDRDRARAQEEAGWNVEPGAEGKPQTVIPGTERRTGEMLQRKAEAPLKGKVAQKPMDKGLFSDEAAQTDMFSGKPKDIVTPAFFGGGNRNFQQRQAAARRNYLRKIEKSYKMHFDPGRLSNESLMAEPMFGKRNSRIAQAQDQLYREGDRRRAAWNKVPEDRQLQFMHDMETGMPVEQAFQGVGQPHAKAPRALPFQKLRPLRAAADVYKKLLDEAFMLEQMWGSKARYFEDYWPHIWENPKGYVKFMENTHGSTWFQKARTFELIEDGLAAGFKLKTTNPEELIRMRLMAGADMRFTMQLLHDLNGIRQAENVRTMGPTVAAQLARQGWEEIVAPDRTKWMIAPDVQPLWKNAVKAKGLWADQGAKGDAFRAWMGFKNIWVPLRLAASAFHLLHVAGINTASHWASGLDQLARGRLIGATASFGRGLSPYQGKGRKGRNAWLKDQSVRTASEEHMVELMKEGGFSPMLSEPLRIDASKRLSDAIREKSLFKLPFQVAYHGLRLVIQKAQSALFEHWIPHLKTAAYLNDVAALLRRKPQWQNVQRGSPDAHDRGVALTAIRKSIDNRFGEMFYSNLFWNRFAKDVSIGGFLSLGWNLGFAREFIGGPAEIPARVLAAARITKPSHARKIIRDATNKIKFVMLYLAQGALIAGIISMLFGGKKADELEPMDFTFPAAGGKNPDGSDRRFNTMWYNREIPMVMKHIQEHGGGVIGTTLGLLDVVYGKLLLGPVIELMKNKNYWGQEIVDPEAPITKQTEQVLKHIVKTQLTPMSATGAARAKETGGGKADEWMAYLGFGPAPSYAAKTETMNRIAHMYREYKAPPKRPYQDPDEIEGTNKARTALMKAIQSGDKDEIRDAVNDAREAGLSKQYIDKRLKGETSTDTMFKMLDPRHQVSILERAPPDEREHYQKHLSKKGKALWEDKHGKFKDGGVVGYQDGGYVDGDSEEEPSTEIKDALPDDVWAQAKPYAPPARPAPQPAPAPAPRPQVQMPTQPVPQPAPRPAPRAPPSIAERQYDPSSRDPANVYQAPRVGGFYTNDRSAPLRRGRNPGVWKFSDQEVAKPEETPRIRRLPKQNFDWAAGAGQPPDPTALMDEYRRSIDISQSRKFPVYADGGLTRGTEGTVGDAAGAFSENRTIDAIERMHQTRMREQGIKPEAPVSEQLGRPNAGQQLFGAKKLARGGTVKAGLVK